MHVPSQWVRAVVSLSGAMDLMEDLVKLMVKSIDMEGDVDKEVLLVEKVCINVIMEN